MVAGRVWRSKKTPQGLSPWPIRTGQPHPTITERLEIGHSPGNGDQFPKDGRNQEERCRHTLVFERVPPQESIQTYSAITRPRWSRDMYLRSCSTPWEVSICISSLAQRPLWKSNASRFKRTFSVLETTVESAACRKTEMLAHCVISV